MNVMASVASVKRSLAIPEIAKVVTKSYNPPLLRLLHDANLPSWVGCISFKQGYLTQPRELCVLSCFAVLSQS